jgi:hypothetical protein
MEEKVVRLLHRTNGLLVSLMCLLVLCIGILGYLGYLSYYDLQNRLDASSRREQQITEIMSRETEIMLTSWSLLLDYHDTAYDNPDVNRISEQQLIATETLMNEMQNLMIQNDLLLQGLACSTVHITEQNKADESH